MTSKPPEDVFDDLMEDNDQLWDIYDNLRAHNVPEEEALRSIKGQYAPTPEYPDSVPDSPQDSIERCKVSQSTDVAQLGRDMQGGSRHIVYFVECELVGGPRLKDTKREALRFLPSVDEPPDWIYYAWKADRVYYIGQTSNFEVRLPAHCHNTRDGIDSAREPSILTAISEVSECGVIARVEDRCTAEQLEESVAKKWKTKTDYRFVYYA